MAARRVILITAVLLAAGLSARQLQAQGQIPDPSDPGLPFENPDTNLPPQEILGFNSFGAGRLIPGHHNDIPRPPLEGIEPEVLIPPFHHVPRYYIYCYYYGCRPWLVHPYTGATLAASQVLNSVASTNPDFQKCAAGKTLEEMMEVDDQIGEPLVQVDNLGLVDEDATGLIKDAAGNEVPGVIMDCDEQDQQEHLNAQAVGANLGGRLDLARNPNLIVHTPFYGLYCFRVRICVPILDISNHITSAGQIVPWRFYCRFRFLRHQPICWKRTWWYRWYPNFTVYARPWRPWCLPHIFWTRSGPDWVAHIQSVNRYRHWCLWGFRYYIPRLTTSTGLSFDPQNLGRVPRVAQLNAALNPQVGTWLRYWPYPRVRYWPYRPYCTRWFWFRCLPWYWYRHYSPVIHFAVGVPKAEYGAGFVDDVEIQQGAEDAPLDPPNLADGEPQLSGDSFFDIFTDLDIECRGRAELHPIGDQNGDGLVNSADNPIGVRQTAAIRENPDADDKDDDEDTTGEQ